MVIKIVGILVGRVILMGKKQIHIDEDWMDAGAVEAASGEAPGRAPWSPPKIRTLSTPRDTESGNTSGSDGKFFS
jgi:hypothetical protein